MSNEFLEETKNKKKATLFGAAFFYFLPEPDLL